MNTASKVQWRKRDPSTVIFILADTMPAFERVNSIQSEKQEVAVGIALVSPILVRSQAVVAREVAGEILIVPIRGKVGDLASIYSFNASGSFIWNLLEFPQTVAQLSTAIAAAFEIELARAEEDVVRFVAEMKSAGLIDVSTAAKASPS
jgi:hypothetical protein